MSLCVNRKSCNKGLRGFFSNNLYVLLAFLIPAVLMGITFVLREFFPFGNKMILVSDAWHQYYPFLLEYQQMLKEGQSIMYSWNTGGGSSFVGVIANYLASPLYMLSAFVPTGTPWLQAFLAFTVLFRIGCAGMFFAVFLRKVFGRNDLSISVFSVMYALCAFVLGYYWNMMWLDAFAMLPLVIAGVIDVLKNKRFGLYIISLALSVMFSFYIGYMVCLFVFIVSVCYTIVSFVNLKESIKNAGKMLGCTAVALMITAAVTVPAFLCLNASDSSADTSGFPLEYTINYGYGYADNNIINTLLAIARTATNMLAYTRPITMDKGLPNIACGVLALVLIPFYFVTKKISLKEKIVSGSLCVFFLLSFVVNQLNYIWHGMNTPAMVYYRWSFIFSFAVIVMAYRAFTLIDSFGKKTFIASCGLLGVYLAAAFVFQKKLSVAITFAGAVVILLGFILYRKRKITYKVLTIILCLFVIGEMGLSANFAVRTVGRSALDDYPKNSEAVSELLEVIGAKEKDEIFRTEFTDTYTLNDGALYSFYGISTFNSMVDSSYADVLKDLGLAASKGNNRYAYIEGTPVENLLLNIRYLISREDQPLYDAESMNLIATADECAVYENKYYVPMGFMTSTELLEDYTKTEGWTFPGAVQNQWFSRVTGLDADVLTEVDPLSEVHVEFEDKLVAKDSMPHFYNYNITDVKAPESTQDEASDEKEGTPLWVEYEIEEAGNYYGIFKTNTIKEATVIINSDEDNSRKIEQNYTNLVALGHFEKGDKIKAEMSAEYGKNNNIIYKLVKLNEDVMEQGVEILRKNTMELTRWTDRGLKGTVKADESGLFYTSVLYTDGWKAYVDGEEVEIKPVHDTFIALELSQGEHEIEFRFTTPGIYAGIVVSCVGVLLCAALLVISAKKRSIMSNTCEDVVNEEIDVEQNCTYTE